MACRRSCGCLSAADLGQPGGAAQLGDDGLVLPEELTGPWHVIGAPGEPPFLHGWENLPGGDWRDVAYRRNADGEIVMRGVASSGTVGQSVFDLPLADRPDDDELFSIATGTASDVGTLEVFASTGGVVPAAAGNSYVSLSGVRFYPGAF